MAHLGGFSEEALLLFQHAASEQGYDFSEGGDIYDFTRCVRPDGSAYGTSGRCRKGSEQAKKPKEPKAARGGGSEKPKVTATPGMAAKAKAAREKLGVGKSPAPQGEPKKMKTDFKKEVEAAAVKRRAREAKMGELQTEIADRKKAWQEAEAQVRAAKKGWQEAKAMTAAQRKTPEGQKKLREAGRALDKAERAAEKSSNRMFASQRKLSRMTMTPEQRKEEREWNRTKRELG